MRRTEFADVTYCEEFPADARPDLLYLMTYSGDKLENVGSWALSFLCPCGCGKQVGLSLLTNERPHWRVTASRTSPQRLTVTPSVHRTEGCRSHFFIRDNKVDWC